eukprot:scaffold261_cov170-Amphora_coffeaeformis.AAC.14
MGRRSVGSGAASASRQGGTLQQLDSLRSFVPQEMGFTESDLTDCLRQCGFNVNTAAERLITGDYQRSKGGKKTFLKMTAASSPDRRKSTHSSQSSSKKTPKQMSLSTNKSSLKRKDPPTLSNKKDPPRKSPFTSKSATIDLSLDEDDDNNAENKHNEASLLRKTANNYKVAASNSINKEATNPPGDWLLCQRWISDAICTSRSGAMDHKEVLHTEASGPTFLRLRGRALEGRFPDHIGRLLNPLLRENLVKLEAHSLMQEKNLPTGASIPVSLSVYLPDPRSFFEVFSDTSTMAQSSKNMFFENKNKGRPPKHKASNLEQAAWDLLQWAQNGDVPDFSTERRALQDSNVDSEGKEEELDEKDFEDSSEEETSDKAKEWSASLTSAERTSRLPECDDPVGLRDVQLRPYQRQALEWMRRREVDTQTREEQEEQLALLTELSRTNQASNCSPSHTASQDILCDCGPVQASSEARERAMTCDGEVNPASHPLWQRRFLTDPDRKELIVFFVNEFMGIASHRPASPPKPCSGGILADAMGLGVSRQKMKFYLKSLPMLIL